MSLFLKIVVGAARGLALSASTGPRGHTARSLARKVSDFISKQEAYNRQKPSCHPRQNLRERLKQRPCSFASRHSQLVPRNPEDLSSRVLLISTTRKQLTRSELNTHILATSQELPNPYTDLELFLRIAESAASQLPEPVLQQVSALKANALPENFLLFKGLPTDPELPDTPGADSTARSKQTFISEFCLSLFARLLGEPFNYIQEETGVLFRNIRPTQRNESEQTSDGSKVILELHTEQAFHDFRPDYLMLCCLRGDRTRRAFTQVSSLNRILPLLDSKTIAELRKPQFITGIDVSFGNRDKTKTTKTLIPVLYGSNEDPQVTYDLDLMKAPTAESRAALDCLKEAALQVQESIALEPGDLVFFDNKRAIHGRTAFQAFYDGKDRWLQRVYVSTDPKFKDDVHKTGRVITTTF